MKNHMSPVDAFILIASAFALGYSAYVLFAK